MISRKKIISRSEDSNDNDSLSSSSKEETDYDENTWTNVEQLFNDQIEEIANKWNQIDDEIWAKIVCFEQNRRIAKAYARSQVVSVTGSERSFDGYRIGLNGFPNCRRNRETEVVKRQIKSGFKIKIDEVGNIFIKRLSKCSIYICNMVEAGLLKPLASEASNSRKGSPFHTLELNQAEPVFDMRKFQQNLHQTLTGHGVQPHSNAIRWLQYQCIHCVQLVLREEYRILKHPCWIVLINIVALDMLWSRFRFNSPPLLRPPPASEFCNRFGQQKAVSGHHHHHHYCGNKQIKDNNDLYYGGYAAKVSVCRSKLVKSIQEKPIGQRSPTATATATAIAPSNHRYNRVIRYKNSRRVLQHSRRLFSSTQHLSTEHTSDDSGKSSNNSNSSRSSTIDSNNNDGGRLVSRKANHKLCKTFNSNIELRSEK